MNFNSIIERIMQMKGIDNEKEVAKLFGLSGPDFSNRKKRGTLLPFIMDWALNENVNLNWLIKGEGEKHPLDSFCVAEKQGEFMITGHDRQGNKVIAQSKNHTDQVIIIDEQHRSMIDLMDTEPKKKGELVALVRGYLMGMKGKKTGL